MKKSSFLCVLMVAALLSGCSKSEPVAPLAGDEGGEIGMRSSVTDVKAAPSRTPFEGIVINEEHPLEALVLTSLASYDYTKGNSLVSSSPSSAGTDKLYCEGKMVFKGEDYAQYEPNVDFGSFKFYDYTATPEKPHYLTGLYPYKNNQSTQAKWNDDDGDGAYELTLTGMEDLMLATQKTATYKQVYKEDPHEYQVLNFEHQLTLLKLKFIKEDNKPDLNIKLISVKVTDALGGLKLKALAKVSTSPQVVEFPDVITPSYSCYKWGVNAAYTAQTYDVPEEQNVPGDANPDAYVLVPPVDASNADGTFEYTFEIDYENENGDLEKGVPVKVSLGYSETAANNNPVTGSTKGYAYKIVLKFVEGHIRCTAAIASDWTDGTPTDYDI